MAMRRLSEYSALLLLLCCILTGYLGYLWLAVMFYAAWYLLYGFVGLATLFNKIHMIKTSVFFLAITFPYALLPIRKAFYYWTKSINTTRLNSNAQKAFQLANKVNSESLYTDNNKSIYFAYLAALHCDLNDKESAFKYIQMARELPHKEMVNENIEKIMSILEN